MPSKKEVKSVHVAHHLPEDPAALLTRCRAIWAAIKADSQRFGSPYPDGKQIDAELQDLDDALQAVHDGSKTARAEVRVAAKKVRGTFGLLTKYVESVVRAGPVEEAEATIAAALLHVSNVGKRPAKAELAAKRGAQSGTALVLARVVAGALVYHWEQSEDGQTWTEIRRTGQATLSVTGLTPGQVYYFRFRAFLRDGTMSDPSPVASIRVL